MRAIAYHIITYSNICDSTMPSYIILHSAISKCTKISYTALLPPNYTILYCTTPHYAILSYTILIHTYIILIFMRILVFLVVLKLVPIPEHVYSCLCTHKVILILILIFMLMLTRILYCTTLLLYYTTTLLDFILHFTVL